MTTTTTLPNGVFPTMITPFLPTGEIDWPRVDALVDWYIANGCSGIFSVCQSSEMYNLTREERLQLASRVHKRAAGRVSVVASGTFAGSIEEKAEFVLEMGKIVDAVVVLVNQMCAEGESEDVWKANVSTLLSLTGTTPLGLYECPVPYHRLLTADTLKWCAETGRFLFHKDTCCRRDEIAAKLAAVQSVNTPFKFYNANIATLQYSMKLGGSGFSGICANFYPQLVVWLVRNATKVEADEVQDWLSIAENVVMYKYPLSSKKFHSIFSSYEGTPYLRTNPTLSLNEEETTKLECLFRASNNLSTRLELPDIPPKIEE